jgi:hypothetical protein
LAAPGSGGCGRRRVRLGLLPEVGDDLTGLAHLSVSVQRRTPVPFRLGVRAGRRPKSGLGQMGCPRPAFVFFFVFSFSCFLVLFKTFS